MQLHWTLFITNFCLYVSRRGLPGFRNSILITKLLCKAVLLAIRKREFPFCRTLSDLEGATNTDTKICQCEKWFVIIILTNTSSLTNRLDGFLSAICISWWGIHLFMLLGYLSTGVLILIDICELFTYWEYYPLSCFLHITFYLCFVL